ncbi:ependymin-like [Gouania willdenowi]|uniref:Ependymin-like n=1 Tax=Gouania willdenowi TaxID=441366 RepID=A0A8C5HIG8_GOUWI|nr:ependymin-like [Gouania willdenowi]
MNFTSVLSCLCLLLAAAAAQAPKPCVTPPLMSGAFNVAANGHISSTGLVTYDAFGQKIRLRGYVQMGNESFALDQLMLFKQKLIYEVDWSTHTCRKLPLDTAFIPMQVPEDSKLVGQVVLGTSSAAGMGVLVNNWYGKLPDDGLYSTVFTEIGCIPMTYSSFSPGGSWSAMSTVNWVLGITNPTDLLPPAICANAKLEKSEAPVNFFTALASLAMRTQREV